jgi:hypothetical protein
MTTTRIVSERFIAKIDFSSWIQETFRVSPDNRRVAYVAWARNKQFVVVDGKEEKQYDGIVTIFKNLSKVMPIKVFFFYF